MLSKDHRRSEHKKGKSCTLSSCAQKPFSLDLLIARQLPNDCTVVVTRSHEL